MGAGFGLGAIANTPLQRQASPFQEGWGLLCPSPNPGTANPLNYTSRLPGTILLNPAYSITLADGAGWQGCNLLNNSAAITGINLATATTRTLLNAHAAFAGTGILSGANNTIRDAYIMGFSIGINSSHGSDSVIEDVNVDADQCMIFDNAHSPLYIRRSHCDVYLAKGTSYALHSGSIAGIADNGAGLYRITISAADTFWVTGDVVWLTGATGAQSAMGKFAVTVIDSTHLDLQASSSAPTVVTATAANNSFVLSGLSSIANIRKGQTVTGGVAQSGATVLSVWPGINGVILSSKLTGSGAAAYTFTDAAYSTGGSVNIDAGQRTGPGFTVTNSEEVDFVDVFSNLHTVGFYLSTGASWVHLTQPSCDSTSLLQDPYSTCFLLDGTAKGTSSLGGQIQATGQAIVNKSAGTDPHSFVGLDLNPNGSNAPAIELDSGAMTLTGLVSGNAGPLYIAQANVASGMANMGGLFKASFVPQGGTARGLYSSIGGINFSNSYAGTVAYTGQTTFGGSSATCNDNLGNCSFTVAGPEVDGLAQSIAMTTGATQSLPGNGRTFFLTAGGGITNYTLSMPTNGAGSRLLIWFQQAVTSLSYAGKTTYGPTSAAANSWHTCQVDPTGAYWACN